MRRNSRLAAALGCLALTLPLLLIACTSDPEGTRPVGDDTQPTATALGNGPTPSPTPASSVGPRISVFELGDGDCFDWGSSAGDEVVEEVTIVPCDGAWDARVLANIPIVEGGAYPGELNFDRVAYQHCDRAHTYTLFPTEEGWQRGDRVLACIQEKEGFELMLVDRVEVGECYSEPSAPGFEDMYALKSCSGADWEATVAGIVVAPEAPSFPGDRYLEDLAVERCPEPWAYYRIPTEYWWEVGDREVLCLNERA